MAGNVPGNLSHAGLNGDGGALTNAVSVADGGISDENRKVFIWVAELLDPTRREAALMELSKKREQVPELALVIWHSFGMALLHRICCLREASCKLADIVLVISRRRYDCFITGNNFCLPALEPFSVDCRCFESSL